MSPFIECVNDCPFPILINHTVSVVIKGSQEQSTSLF